MQPQRKIRRLWTCAGILATLILLIAACGPTPTAAPPTAAPAAAPATAAAAKEVALNFVVWSYSIETIQDNIAKFEAQTPGVKVNLSDFSWNDYHDTMATRFTGGTPTQVA